MNEESKKPLKLLTCYKTPFFHHLHSSHHTKPKLLSFQFSVIGSQFSIFLSTMENNGGRRRMNTSVPVPVPVPDEVIKCLLTYHPELRDLITRTCPTWKKIEASERTCVKIPMCYSIKPTSLKKRYVDLLSLKLKGKPRPAKFGLLPKNWGGYATPWVEMIKGYKVCLTSLHFKSMIFTDDDLSILATRESLISLKLERCSGFSTDGLKAICHNCTNLQELSIEGSKLKEDLSENENGGEWLHELALKNKVLKRLSFYNTEYESESELGIQIHDLELLAENCPGLVSMKTNCEIFELVNFFRRASSLEEFCGRVFEVDPTVYADVSLPAKLSQLGLVDIKPEALPFLFPSHATQLKKLDLCNASLDTEGHCRLIQKCPNLEILESQDVIGDGGLVELGRWCKKLKRLRIIKLGGAPVPNAVTVTQTGINSIAIGCLELEYMSVHVSDITISSLQHIGAHLKNLCDFRLTLADNREEIPDLPLDDGVRDLLLGCVKLRRFALYLMPGWLTDVGLGYIGQHSPNVRWMLLGNVGDTDAGLLAFSGGCSSLEKLFIRGYPFFRESALAQAAKNLQSLKLLWVQGYKASASGLESLATARKDWNTEVIPSGPGQEYQLLRQDDQILCYHSLAGPRTDIPRGSWCPMVLNCNS